ncbi:MAG: valine--tRNA ligase, partial [Acidobacteriota bacterium]
MDIPKQFDPKTCEDKWYSAWEENGTFQGRPDSGKEPFVIVIPPPNVTGVLHAGHAMFVTLQDILIRWKRMSGFDALWIPGTDHAGIATQMVVAKELAKQGRSREQLGREKFVEEVWKWREEKGDTILYQMKKLGASCDWGRTRFTLDRDLSKAVRKVFVDLYREGLIYRGEYMINWCPACGTALSDLEVDHREKKGHLWHILYKLKGGDGEQGLTVATTRPETLLGDTAVAVHPDDPRYRGWIGKRVVLPILGRAIPVVGDTMVDLEFGTGAVKITPAHDPNDFEAGKRHNLESIEILNPDGTLNKNAGPYAGMERFEARKAVVKRLETNGLLKRTEEHTHAVGHCQRCGEVVEPRVSTQWFLKIEPLASPARRAVESGEIRIIPEHWRKVYLNWMADIHDWCISRQLWWGHQIPAWYCSSCGRGAGRDDPEMRLVSMDNLESC